MALSEIYALNGVSIGTTEYSIPNGGTSLQNITTDAVVSVWFDGVANMAISDRFQVAIKEKVLSGSTQRQVFRCRPSHAQSEPYAFPPLMLMHGWDVTLQKIDGTDRALYASVRGNTTTITEAYTLSAVSVGASELSIVSGTTSLQTITTGGIYQLFVDPVAASMAKADQFTIRIYERINATGGTKRQVFESTLHDVQDQIFVSPMLHLLGGWDMTIQKDAGTDRSFDASIRRVG